jgi:hypothetical protein
VGQVLCSWPCPREPVYAQGALSADREGRGVRARFVSVERAEKGSPGPVTSSGVDSCVVRGLVVGEDHGPFVGVSHGEAGAGGSSGPARLRTRPDRGGGGSGAPTVGPPGRRGTRRRGPGAARIRHRRRRRGRGPRRSRCNPRGSVPGPGVAEAILEAGRVSVRPGRLFSWEDVETSVRRALQST